MCSVLFDSIYSEIIITFQYFFANISIYNVSNVRAVKHSPEDFANEELSVIIESMDETGRFKDQNGTGA